MLGIHGVAAPWRPRNPWNLWKAMGKKVGFYRILWDFMGFYGILWDFLGARMVLKAGKVPGFQSEYF